VIERRGEDPSTPLVLACFRAGAADVIDLTLEGTAPARAVVARVWQEQRARVADRQTAATLRGLVEDFFRSLIRTERRSLDLEGRLARSGGIAADATDEERPPGVLLVEGDRALAGELTDVLTRAGLATFAYVSAEDVLYAVDNLLARGAGFDLALIAAQLPGMDGIELLRDLRHRIPDLPAFIMTAPGERVARDAAGLGVVGYAEKPLADLAELVGHVGRLARQAHLRTREHMYLKAIKDRHERVLAQYRALPPET
jgi:CheY-like chemotaxis protein